MAIEIERKYLVKNNSFLDQSYKKVSIRQGFLNSDKNRVVRVRIKDDKGYLTIKGLSNSSGITRNEWEYQIDIQDAQELLSICEPSVIEKYRYYIKHDLLEFEVDVFKNDNEGLIIAEIELSDENQEFDKPDWLGKEVSGDDKYYNSSLSKKPFKSWT